MKSLQTIQKTFYVFQILAKIAMTLSFVWAGLAALGALCALVWGGGGTVFGANQELMYALTETGGLKELTAAMLADTVFALTDGTLFAFAYRCLKAEQAAGTPFTHDGAVKVRRLGISVIVMPNVAAIVSAVVYACYNAALDVDWSTAASTLLGVVLILAALVFQCGADLEAERT